DATYRRGDLLIQSGQWEHGRAQLTAALELVDPQHDRLLHGRVLRGLAICAVRMGRPTEAVARLEEAVAGYRAASDPLNELVTSSNLLAAHYELGAWGEVEAVAERVLSLALELGDPITHGIACQHLGLAAMAVGERARARALVLEAEAQWDRAQRRRLVGLA